METTEIKRHGNHIRFGGGITAIEGWGGNLPTLRIRKDGQDVKIYRGAGLYFSTPLTAEDREFLRSLVADLKTTNSPRGQRRQQ